MTFSDPFGKHAVEPRYENIGKIFLNAVYRFYERDWVLVGGYPFAISAPAKKTK